VQYFNWLEDQIARNVPLDVMVKTLLTATGPSFESPAANFLQGRARHAQADGECRAGVHGPCGSSARNATITRSTRWTMNDYYSFAAFFAQVGRKAGEDPRETIVFNPQRWREASVTARTSRRNSSGGTARHREGRGSPTSVAGWLGRRRIRISRAISRTSSGRISSAKGSSIRSTTFA
jgi:hypothetical protein